MIGRNGNLIRKKGTLCQKRNIGQPNMQKLPMVERMLKVLRNLAPDQHAKRSGRKPNSHRAKRNNTPKKCVTKGR